MNDCRLPTAVIYTRGDGRWRTIDVVGGLKLIYNNQYSILLGLAAINYDILNIDRGLIL
jgi:hypothetical protein